MPGAEALTKDEAAAQSVEEFSDGGNVLVTVVLGFAAVALLVAALVIANTFQVLVAQRTRTLALLRCVGAGKGQLRRSVLLEAAILGSVASRGGARARRRPRAGRAAWCSAASTSASRCPTPSR